MVEEGLVAGLAPPQIVRGMIKTYGLTPRQAWHDLHQVQDQWRRQDDEIRQNRWRLVDLAVASDCCDREFHAALAAGDARRALRAEQHRSKLLGIYAAQRQKTRHATQVERKVLKERFERDLPRMYDEAPRNPDGSVVLTAYSLTPPDVWDDKYCESIEHPLRPNLSRRRQERLDALRALLAAGQRMDQLEALAMARYGLSARQVRDDIRRLEHRLEFDGYLMHQGTHNVQLLPLALRRRERIAELARHGPPEPRDHEAGVARSEQGCEGRGEAENARGGSDGTGGNGENREADGASAQPSVASVSSCSKQSLRVRRAKFPDLRLLADIEIDRCRLLGLYFRDRPSTKDDDLRWSPPEWRDPERCRPPPEETDPAVPDWEWPERRDTAGGEQSPWDEGTVKRGEGAAPEERPLQTANCKLQISNWGPLPNDIRKPSGGGLESGSGEGACHPERSEGSQPPREILRCAQNDSEGPNDSGGDALSGRNGLPRGVFRGGRVSDPCYYPPRGPVQKDGDVDRMIEEDFARRDAKRGFRHTVAELWPGVPGRQRWELPEDAAA